ncbi:MAG: 16S rRNA (cytidine(1402)-2'-O)-methyltransferase [Pyrinomonadaceae bacterium]|nr:16S rRNA (cytidine(1402)-2'-O)-methyltransferase [Pyrinomonadaceae bacterium]MCX7639614.1 16S rRNA (cytidine(1402)-2'-O)-methyltransferase [Pyrinomonadaceae bacterium]MDW8303368.1 16S rRNA (cytidine(1402)-2'-O)-methyltransferase [Acidobacteriota bacterium]
MSGKLYVVSTPIGNLKDISLRAIEILSSVDVIACEDTRQTRKLLSHYQIKGKKTLSYNEQNEKERAEKLVKIILDGKDVALVSDAGTPSISDPGYRLVQKAYEVGISVISIPGPTAFVSALVVSGLPTDALFFSGFLPSKRAERIAFLQEVKSIAATLCFYETPHRLRDSLVDCLNVLGNRKAAVVREISKVHEEVIRGDLEEIIEAIPEKVKGEIVLVIDRDRSQQKQEVSDEALVNIIKSLQEKGLSRKEAIKEMARRLGLRKNQVYKIFQNFNF